ncbi:MAG TPA: hypothetical protein VMQ38_21715 [Mycobacterium sp.]|nr:hypothetical protein [Mycobacterium sp.]
MRERWPSRRGCRAPEGEDALTAPTKNRFDVDAVGGRDQSDEPKSGADANNRAGRVTHLLNEIVAKGVLPAL